MAVPGDLRSRVFRPPLVPPDVPVREAPSTSFADLVRMLAEGVADAQASLDKTSADMVVELSRSKVQIIPKVTETIDEEGNVSFEQAPPKEVSLLEVGVEPTFYQFSEAKVEVVMDMVIVETETEASDGKSRYSLFARTADIRFERKLKRDVSVSSKFSATLVPVPKPLRVGAMRVTNSEDSP